MQEWPPILLKVLASIDVGLCALVLVTVFGWPPGPPNPGGRA